MYRWIMALLSSKESYIKIEFALTQLETDARQIISSWLCIKLKVLAKTSMEFLDWLITRTQLRNISTLFNSSKIKELSRMQWYPSRFQQTSHLLNLVNTMPAMWLEMKVDFILLKPTTIYLISLVPTRTGHLKDKACCTAKHHSKVKLKKVSQQ